MKREYKYKTLFSPQETGQEVENEILLKQTDQQDNFSGFSLSQKLLQITEKLAIILFCKQNVILLPNFLFYSQNQNMDQIVGLCPISQSCLCVTILFPECISTGLKA